MSLTKIGGISIKSYRNLETSIGFYTNLIGIYKDQKEIDDELEKYRSKINNVRLKS